jgi:hypothetical protein
MRHAAKLAAAEAAPEGRPWPGTKGPGPGADVAARSEERRDGRVGLAKWAGASGGGPSGIGSAPRSDALGACTRGRSAEAAARARGTGGQRAAAAATSARR